MDAQPIISSIEVNETRGNKNAFLNSNHNQIKVFLI